MNLTSARLAIISIMQVCMQAELDGKQALEPEMFNVDPVVRMHVKELLDLVYSTKSVLDPLISETSQITIDPALSTLIDNWEESPEKFEAHVSSRQTPLEAPGATAGFGARCFLIKCSIKDNTITDRVCSRFWDLIYYRFYRECQLIVGSTRDVLAEMSECLRPAGLSSWVKEDIRAQLSAWVTTGERYELLIQDLGGVGALFFLPLHLDESFRQIDVQMSSPKQSDLTLSLRERGIDAILRQMRADEAAAKVLEHYVPKFMSWFAEAYRGSVSGKPQKKKTPARKPRAQTNRVRKPTEAKRSSQRNSRRATPPQKAVDAAKPPEVVDQHLMTPALDFISELQCEQPLDTRIPYFLTLPIQRMDNVAGTTLPSLQPEFHTSGALQIEYATFDTGSVMSTLGGAHGTEVLPYFLPQTQG
ncbi:hypothetical protein BO78DRAFT_417758 [Aspergillus sclerotiicarbonarius CBS 121057]|uniref:Uncharacterized protein n=1 Tax=Aspergillus sclerotiicarbonarius (strain CBS 121057 / IBT 28362) TaxID=1448318 RepID=A0A319EBC7_ASPSB|nr:hypothetical protein BO78DRAFT_417758 [Aspergillus sclerotiicarbonarius CBS 121057]